MRVWRWRGEGQLITKQRDRCQTVFYCYHNHHPFHVSTSSCSRHIRLRLGSEVGPLMLALSPSDWSRRQTDNFLLISSTSSHTPPLFSCHQTGFTDLRQSCQVPLFSPEQATRIPFFMSQRASSSNGLRALTGAIQHIGISLRLSEILSSSSLQILLWSDGRLIRWIKSNQPL